MQIILKPLPQDMYLPAPKPLHIGKSTSIWDVKITNDKDELVSNITFTAMHKDL